MLSPWPRRCPRLHTIVVVLAFRDGLSGRSYGAGAGGRLSTMPSPSRPLSKRSPGLAKLAASSPRRPCGTPPQCGQCDGDLHGLLPELSFVDSRARSSTKICRSALPNNVRARTVERRPCARVVLTVGVLLWIGSLQELHLLEPRLSAAWRSRGYTK